MHLATYHLESKFPPKLARFARGLNDRPKLVYGCFAHVPRKCRTLSASPFRHFPTSFVAKTKKRGRFAPHIAPPPCFLGKLGEGLVIFFGSSGLNGILLCSLEMALACTADVAQFGNRALRSDYLSLAQESGSHGNHFSLRPWFAIFCAAGSISFCLFS